MTLPTPEPPAAAPPVERQLLELVHSLQQQVAELRAEVRGTTSPPVPRPADSPRPGGSDTPAATTRRRLLRSLPAALAGAAGAGALLTAEPAGATAGSPLILGRGNDAGSDTTVLLSTANTALQVENNVVADRFVGRSGHFTLGLAPHDPWEFPPLQITGRAANAGNTTSSAIWANSVGPYAAILVNGQSGDDPDHPDGLAVAAGVDRGTAVYAGADRGNGVRAACRQGNAVRAEGSGAAVALSAESSEGPVLAAAMSSTTATTPAVILYQHGHGRAVSAVSANTGKTDATITATNRGSGASLAGIQSNPTATGAAITGQAAARGRGGQFSGGVAAVRLVPGSSSTHPSSGQAGDLFVDRSNRLWFCKGGTTWKQVA